MTLFPEMTTSLCFGKNHISLFQKDHSTPLFLQGPNYPLPGGATTRPSSKNHIIPIQNGSQYTLQARTTSPSSSKHHIYPFQQWPPYAILQEPHHRPPERTTVVYYHLLSSITSLLPPRTTLFSSSNDHIVHFHQWSHVAAYITISNA